MKTELIIIRGTPGAGKSSLGRRLKKVFPDGVFIEVDNVRGMINNVDWNSEDEHLVALNAVAANATSFLSDKKSPVIIADMFMPDKLNLFLKNFPRMNYCVISLLVNENSLTQRLSDRKEGFKDIDQGKRMNILIRENSCMNELVIDTSEITKNEIAEAVHKFLVE
jgi:broad-specificity NMP kinase